MDRRNFLSYCSLLGLTLPFLPKKTVAACQKRWDLIGEVTIQRLELIPELLPNGPITEDSYIPYEKFIEWKKSHRNKWEKKIPLEKWLVELEEQQSDLDYRVFEDGVAVGRLTICLNDTSIQFQSYVLDELMTLKNWDHDDIVLHDGERFFKEFQSLVEDPLATAIICVKNFRAKTKTVFDKIITYYNERSSIHTA